MLKISGSENNEILKNFTKMFQIWAVFKENIISLNIIPVLMKQNYYLTSYAVIYL